MCGVAGIFTQKAQAIDEIVRGMIAKIRHRGPDDSGVWTDAQQGIGLGQARLSIVDLSPLGHQPMISSSRRYVLVFNGEIYNYRDLKEELISRGTQFKGGSDTEVLLEGFEHWGIEKTLQRAEGMLAIGLWDNRERTLTLARDKIGKKPLYIGVVQGGIVFGSELKAFRAHGGFSLDLSSRGTAEFFRYNYIPAPHTIFRDAIKLPPASLLTLTQDTVSKSTSVSSLLERCVPYWSLGDAVQERKPRQLHTTEDGYISELREILTGAVQRRMIADVPLGAFLSGGIDSSLIVALMQENSPVPVKTFSIGFEEQAFSESHYAAKVAAHLGTDHTEQILTSGECRAVLPLLPQMFDEPFADLSQIPTYLVSKLARTKVTVALSGDGGDEVFGGYPRYIWAKWIWDVLRWIPARKLLQKMIYAASPQQWHAMLTPLASISSHFAVRNPGEKVYNVARALGALSLHDLYARMVVHWGDEIFKERPVRPAPFSELTIPSHLPPLIKLSLIDLLHYFPDDLMVKVDRASMAVALEARAPYVDPAVIQFGLQLPEKLRMGGGRGKVILKKLLATYLPPVLFERPKVGFGVPMGAWLRGPLKEWGEDLLSSQSLKHSSILNYDVVQRTWREHQEGARNREYLLWDILAFEAWQRSLS